MKGQEAFEVYAPKNAKWVEWVRPVPFVAIDTYNRKSLQDWTEIEAYFINEYQKDIAIFVDLLNEESIEMGIDLAKKGYRPIPVFNGTNAQVGTREQVDEYIIEEALLVGAEKLKNIEIDQNANPAFLLDSTRLNNKRSNLSVFDNSWDLYAQDIPSCQYFIDNGIKKIIVIGDRINSDLRRIFFKFQDKGIEFYQTNGYDEPQKVLLRKTIKERYEKEDI